MPMKSSEKLQFSIMKETEKMTDQIKPNYVSTAARQQRENEIAHFLEYLISKTVETSENSYQSEEQAVDTKDFLKKELHKPSEQIDDFEIVQYLAEKLKVNRQVPEEDTNLNDTLTLVERVKNCVEDIMDTMIKKVENEESKPGKVRSKIVGSTNNSEFGFIETNDPDMGEEIEEVKKGEKIEKTLKNIVKEVLQGLDNDCLEFSNSKSIDKLEIPIKVPHKTNKQNLSKTQHQSVAGIKFLQNSDTLNSSFDCSKQTNAITNISDDKCHKQTKILESNLEQPNMLIKPKNVSSDCLHKPDLQKAIPPSKRLRQENKAKISETSLHKSVHSVQHETTPAFSQQPTNTSGDYLSQASTQTHSSQRKTALKNHLEEANTPEHSFAWILENDINYRETIELAYTVFEFETEVSPKTRRAVSLIKAITEGSRQSDKQGRDNLQEIKIITEIIDGVSDLNEYFQMDIRNILLKQKEIKRISLYVYEHLSSIGYCRSQKFIREDAIGVIQNGMSIYNDIQFLRLRFSKFFRDFFLKQRSFLRQSIQFSSIPYELIIGNKKWTGLVNKVKCLVIEMCSHIFSSEDLDDYHETIMSDYKKIVRRVEEFTESVVLLDHIPYTEMNDED